MQQWKLGWHAGYLYQPKLIYIKKKKKSSLLSNLGSSRVMLWALENTVNNCLRESKNMSTELEDRRLCVRIITEHWQNHYTEYVRGPSLGSSELFKGNQLKRDRTGNRFVPMLSRPRYNIERWSVRCFVLAVVSYLFQFKYLTINFTMTDYLIGSIYQWPNFQIRTCFTLFKRIEKWDTPNFNPYLNQWECCVSVIFKKISLNSVMQYLLLSSKLGTQWCMGRPGVSDLDLEMGIG